MAFHCAQQRVFALPRDQQSPTHIALQSSQGLWQATLPCWQAEPLDWLIICTKAQATLEALQPWQPHLAQVKNILLLQNGMGQQAQLACWLAEQHLSCTLWAGMSTEGAYRQQQRIVYAGVGKNIIGVWPQGDSQAILPPKTELTHNIEHQLRNKLAINAVINPLTAYLGCLNGELLSQPDYRQKMLAVCDEVAGLYQALNWPLDQPLRDYAQQVAQTTANNRSSTLQDKEAGRATELPYISGFLLEHAQQIGYPMPLSAELLHHLDN